MCNENEGGSVIVVPSSIIPEDEFEGTMLKAVRGDGLAAHHLAYHFGFINHDYNASLFWDTIGAENGNYPETQYGLAITLTWPGRDKEDMTRGIFWIYNMVVVDYRDSVEWLERLGHTLESARPPGDALFPSLSSLSGSDLTRYREGALQGSGQAALVLAKYYESIGTDSAEYWYRIGAQNGNKECQRQYGNILLGKEDTLDQERGKFCC